MSTLSTIHDMEQPEEFETRQIIADMLKENTGKHLLDSGSAYGRNWEANQGKEFEEQSAASFDLEEWDGGIDVITSVSTYHFLKHRLEFDREAFQINKQFYERATSGELKDSSWLSCMTACFGDTTVNTYNHEFHNTDQVLQFVCFTLEHVGYADERDPRPEDREFTIDNQILQARPDVHGDWVALQIHGGCDVRGGYTAPVVFKASHGCDYIIMEVTTDVSCPVCGWIGCQYETINEGAWDELELVDEHEESGRTELVHKECGCICELSAAVGV